MRVCSCEISKGLAELGYDWDCMDYYLHGQLNGDEESGYIYPFALWEDFNAIGKHDLKTDLYSATCLLEAMYFLLDKYAVLIVIEPFIYNGVLYNYIPKIYAPSIFDKEPEHMNGLEVLDSNGQYFENYEDALESAVTKSIEILKTKLTKYETRNGHI